MLRVRERAKPVAGPGPGRSRVAECLASLRRVFTCNCTSVRCVPSTSSGRTSRNREPSAATLTDQSRRSWPVTDSTSPWPVRARVRVSGFPWWILKSIRCSLVTADRLAWAFTSAFTEKNNGTSLGTLPSGTRMTRSSESWAKTAAVRARRRQTRVLMRVGFLSRLCGRVGKGCVKWRAGFIRPVRSGFRRDKSRGPLLQLLDDLQHLANTRTAAVELLHEGAGAGELLEVDGIGERAAFEFLGG